MAMLYDYIGLQPLPAIEKLELQVTNKNQQQDMEARKKKQHTQQNAYIKPLIQGNTKS